MFFLTDQSLRPWYLEDAVEPPSGIAAGQPAGSLIALGKLWTELREPTRRTHLEIEVGNTPSRPKLYPSKWILGSVAHHSQARRLFLFKYSFRHFVIISRLFPMSLIHFPWVLLMFLASTTMSRTLLLFGEMQPGWSGLCQCCC